MSHIIKGGYSKTLDKPYCAVKIKVKGKKLIIQDGIVIAKPDTQIAELPENYKIVNKDNEEIQPTNKFYISVETINPYHLIFDM
jgi:hypothetical protein